MTCYAHSPSRNSKKKENEKKKKSRMLITNLFALHAKTKKKGNCKAFCITRKRKNVSGPTIPTIVALQGDSIASNFRGWLWALFTSLF